MTSRPLVLGLLAAGCITAAAGGAYVAVRQNDASRPTPAQQLAASTASNPARPVSESEAVVSPAPARPAEPAADTAATTAAKTPARVERDNTPTAPKREAPRQTPSRPQQSARNSARASASAPAEQPLAVERPSPARDTSASSSSSSSSAGVPHPSSTTPAQAEMSVPEPPAPPARQIVEVVVPASAVVGLQIETSINSETARVEDRVEGRVTRDVMADGRVAIPAGTRVIGDVTLVERGGKMKDKARLGVRFHTLVLADGNRSFRTDTIYREGASPGNESARKIGGAAVGGAILGAIIGGAKGAAIGGATGAGAGSAVVMAGDRNAATLPAGTVVNARLSSPLSVEVEKEN